MLSVRAFRPDKERIMAKSQKKSNKEIRKPKAAKPKPGVPLPVQAPGSVKGLENMRNR